MSYYLMHRGWMDNPVFRNRGPHCERAAWAWLIEHAQYEPTKVRIGGKTVELQRGQLSYSYRYLGGVWGWQHDRARRLIAALQQCDMVATDTATGQLIITICNYDKYQAQPGSGATVNATAVRQQRDSDKPRSATNNKEEKEGKNLSLDANASRESAQARDDPQERNYGPASRKTRIAPDWGPDLADCRYAESLGWDAARIDEQADAFTDRCRRDQPVYADWHAAWRTWCRNADKFGASRPAGVNGSGTPLANLFEGAWRAANELDEQAGDLGPDRGPAQPLLDRR